LGLSASFHDRPIVHLEDLIYETLESVAVSGLVFSLGVKKVDPIQETFKLCRPGPVLFITTQLLYISHREITFLFFS
jgi:hypothetical protein